MNVHDLRLADKLKFDVSYLDQCVHGKAAFFPKLAARTRKSLWNLTHRGISSTKKALIVIFYRLAACSMVSPGCTLPPKPFHLPAPKPLFFIPSKTIPGRRTTTKVKSLFVNIAPLEEAETADDLYCLFTCYLNYCASN